MSCAAAGPTARRGRQIGYVLGIGCDRRLPTAAGPIRADVLAAKGHRYYDWTWVALTSDSGQRG